MSAAPADPAGCRRIVRAPNHLGDVIMALPALAAHGADIMVRRWLAPLLEMADLPGRVLPLDAGLGGWRAAVGALRRGGYEDGVLLTPSFSAAWLFRWGGVSRLRGTDTDGRGWMLRQRLPREVLRGHHRINQYRLLLGQDPGAEPAFRPIRPRPEVLDRWSGRLPARGKEGLVGLFPGSNATARRWPVERFAAVARTFLDRGVGVAILGGAGERALTAAVAAGARGAVDLGGETDLWGLAAILSLCDLVVTNDTGPMHLAGAVGVPTVTLWGPSDPGEVGPPGPRHVRVTGATLPCKPCFKNACPRSGAGTVLPQAHEECMRLIEVDQVVSAVEAWMPGGGA
ncbi:MAG TPA: glycosyltransferase family 9 protein [Longimicrobiales bacterium]|nr:glycosyltransferase family 9 protein [Longimicrobiales bacterium]